MDLPESLRRGVVGLELWQWLAILAVFAVAFLLSWAASLGVAKFLEKRGWGENEEVSRRHAKSVRSTLRWLLFVLLLAWALPSLLLDDGLEEALAHLLFLARIVAMTFLFVALWDVGCDRFSQRLGKVPSREKSLLIPFVRRLGQMVIFVLGLVALLAGFGVNVAGMIAGLGIGGLVLALAAKNSVENIFGSLTVVFDLPFVIGDWIKVGDVEGVVEEINLRSTRVRTIQDSLIVMPNSNLITASIENFGSRRYRRVRLALTVDLRTDTSKLKKFCDALRQLAENHDSVRAGSADVTLFDLTASGALIQFICFLETTDQKEELSEREALILGILRVADQMQVSLATNAPIAEPVASAPSQKKPSELPSIG